MILKQYGTSYQSVEINFDSRALTEISFRRDRAFSIPTEEFEAQYSKVDERSLSASSEGDVHDQAESDLLEALEGEVRKVLAELEDDQVLVVESREGADYPKTRDTKKKVVVDGENRLYFYWTVDPPLRIGIYRKG